MPIISGGGSSGGSITPPVTLTGVDPADAVLTLEAAPGSTALGNSVFRLKDDTGFERWDIDAAGHSEYRNGTGGHLILDPDGYLLITGDIDNTGGQPMLNVTAAGGFPQLTVSNPGGGYGVRAQPGAVGDAALQVAAITDQTGPLIECRDQDYNVAFSVGPTGALTASVPTADPHVVGQVWNDTGTLKVSAG